MNKKFSAIVLAVVAIAAGVAGWMIGKGKLTLNKTKKTGAA